MLPLVFLLSALLLWEAAWRALERGQPARAWLLGFVGVGIASVCAVLSKANGALVPALLACVWWILYRPTQFQLPVASAGTAKWLPRAALLIPGAAVLLALVWQIPSAMEMADVSRPWSLWQRLLSQPRALWDYLALLWIPREGSVGIFADDFKVSTSLLSPWSTLPALLGIAALLAAAVSAKRWAPRLSLALLFYFLGHAVESGPVALEPYFEHRNYLPAVLMFWPFAAWLTAARQDVGMVALRWGLIAILPLLLATLTFTRATVWGNSAQLAALFAERNPDSPRAQLWLAQQQFRSGNQSAAVERLRSAVLSHPDNDALSTNLLTMECRARDVRPETVENVIRAFATMPRWDSGKHVWVREQIKTLAAQGCPEIDQVVLGRVLEAAKSNPRVRASPGRLQDVMSMEGYLALVSDDVGTASEIFRHSLLLQPTTDAALWHIAQLGLHGHPGEGMQHLRFYYSCCHDSRRQLRNMATVHEWIKWKSGYMQEELDRIEQALKSDLKNREAASEISGHGSDR
jgi:hypothetical protein